MQDITPQRYTAVATMVPQRFRFGKKSTELQIIAAAVGFLVAGMLSAEYWH